MPLKRFRCSVTYLSVFQHAGPTGEIVSIADDKEEAVLIAEFDLDKIKSTRHCWGVFRDRRPDLYKVLLTLDGKNPVR
jgi:N-carbamoylputrescine amidase